MAGLKGVPLYGAAELLVSMLHSAFLSDEDEPWDFNTMVRGSVPEMLYYGPLNSILGVDVASRTGFANMLFPYDNPYKRERMGWVYWPVAFMGPAAGIAESTYMAADDLSEGNLVRAVERAAPSFIRNPLKAFRYQMDGVVNRNGVPIMEDVPLYSILMQIGGFAPSELTKRYKENEMAKQYERAVTQRRSGLLSRLNAAKYIDDYDGIAETEEDIDKYNNSKYGQLLPITGKTKKTSYSGFLNRAESALNGVTYNPSLQDPILEEVGMI